MKYLADISSDQFIFQIIAFQKQKSNIKLKKIHKVLSGVFVFHQFCNFKTSPSLAEYQLQQ